MVRVAGKDEVWQVADLFASNFKKEGKSWREHTVFDLKAEEAEKLTLKGGGTQLKLERLPPQNGADGKPRRTVERFRAYGSYAEAFRDWASMMSGNERYAPVMRERRSVEDYASGMQRAGYATDPRYGEKLERTINRALMLGRPTV